MWQTIPALDSALFDVLLVSFCFGQRLTISKTNETLRCKKLFCTNNIVSYIIADVFWDTLYIEYIKSLECKDQRRDPRASEYAALYGQISDSKKTCGWSRPFTEE